MKCLRFLLAVGAVFAATAAGAQEWQTDFSYTWADNLSRTFNAPDRENAAVLDGSVAAEWRRELPSNFSLLVRGEAGLEQVPLFPGIDSVHAGARLELLRKFGLGPFAPVLTIAAAATRTDVHDRGRSNWRAEGGVSVSQRLTETWRASAGGDWQADFARDHPFDVSHHRLLLETTWDVADGWQLGAGASRLWGELTANENADVWHQITTGGYGSALGDYYSTVPWENSPGFEGDWVAYRMDCHADTWWLSLTGSLGANTSVPLRYEVVKVVGRAHLDYTSEFWSLSIVRRF